MTKQSTSTLVKAPVHVQPAPRRREAVGASGRRTDAARCGGEHSPVHTGGIEGVEVVENLKACRRRGQQGREEAGSDAGERMRKAHQRAHP